MVGYVHNSNRIFPTVAFKIYMYIHLLISDSKAHKTKNNRENDDRQNIKHENTTTNISHHIDLDANGLAAMAQWLERRFLTGELSLIYG